MRAASCAAHPSLVQSPSIAGNGRPLRACHVEPPGCLRGHRTRQGYCAIIVHVVVSGGNVAAPALCLVIWWRSCRGPLLRGIVRSTRGVRHLVVKQELRSLDESTMRYCKHATPVPSGVTIREMWWDVDTSSLSSSSSPSSMPSAASAQGASRGFSRGETFT